MYGVACRVQLGMGRVSGVDCTMLLGMLKANCAGLFSGGVTVQYY